ncbi:hypothetical protein BCR44DRAFT_1084492 [Catenaria anguillulae PL171]|uniref:Uncharacterized protein n=1 Tax=Catenaria anguillulae PL171 TaxID=765915 RepID=A0A1Y2HNN8_9FUNG|nr:hypothetical protein BCR44DRAFT_1084492 [Catenaria anguillulae PL171]
MNPKSSKAAEADATFYHPAANDAPAPSYNATDPAAAAPPPSYDDEDSTATISLHSNDTIHLFGCDAATVNRVRVEIVRVWPRGIQEEGESKFGTNAIYKFKLKGYPWVGQLDEAVHSRQLLSGIFRCMLESGWRLLAPLDSIHRDFNRPSLAFLRSTPIRLSSPSDLFSISFNEQDLLRVIGAPPEIQAVVHQTIVRYWPSGIQKANEHHGAQQYKLKGYPWCSVEKTETIHSQILLTQLLARLRKMGYHMFASLNVSGQSDRPDSWFLVKVLSAEF